jgi:hypothetical protein
MKPGGESGLDFQAIPSGLIVGFRFLERGYNGGAGYHGEKRQGNKNVVHFAAPWSGSRTQILRMRVTFC